jgi:hypothetical protein
MTRSRTPARLGLAALGLIASLASAGADEAPTLSKEAVSLQGFALQSPLCLEWGDGCSICLRDEKDAPHCSTPGIACQPGPIACWREKAK